MEARAARRRSSHGNTSAASLNKTLLVLFEAFDNAGTGEIRLKELYEELSTIEGVRVDNKALDRLKRQFHYMDVNHDGSVTFPEFHRAATIALSRDFSTLEQEKACQDFGYELFTLFALYRRQQLARITKSTPIAEFEKFKNMSKLATFTLDMMDQERKKNNAQADIMKKTTTFSQRKSRALAEEKTAVLSAAKRLMEMEKLSDDLELQELNDAKTMAIQEVNAICNVQRQRLQHRLNRDLQESLSTSAMVKARKGKGLTKRGHEAAGLLKSTTTTGKGETKSSYNANAARRRSSLPSQHLVVPPTMSNDAEGMSSSSSTSTLSSWLSMSKQVQSSSNNYHDNANVPRRKRSNTPMPEGGNSRVAECPSTLVPLLLGPQERGGATDVNSIHKRRVNALKAHGANPNYLLTQILE